MDKTITDGFDEIRKDLEEEFKNHQELNGATVGNNYNPPDSEKTDYTMERGQFKFKVYIKNTPHIITRPFENIQDYPTSRQKEDFIKNIVKELLEETHDR